MNEKKLWTQAERFLKRTSYYQKNKNETDELQYELIYILTNPLSPKDEIAIAANIETEIQFNPYSGNIVDLAAGGGWNYERDLFEPLEEGFVISGMPLASHHAIWKMISNDNCEVFHKRGLQKYLHYCREHGISLQKLQESDGACENIANLMSLYQREPKKQKNSNRDNER